MISLLSDTLLHFLWQGTALALLLALFLKLARQASPSARYLASSATLLLMVAVPVLTFLLLARAPEGVTPEINPPTFSSEANLNPASAPPIAIPTAAIATDAIVLTPSGPEWSQWVVGCWLAGMFLLSVRFVLNWVSTHRLRCSGTLVTDLKLRSEFDQLWRSLGLCRPIPLLESTRCRVPMVIGWWKPVVLVPASLLTGMPSDYLRAIFTHELAHIRRHDYLINLLQHLVEALLFFHPAVWWTSRQLRRERELCCDDHAAASHGVLTYCEALLSLERQLEPGAVPQLAPAANGSKLLERIKRLAQRKPDYRSAAPAAFLTLLIPILVASTSFLPTQAERVPVAEELTPPTKTESSKKPTTGPESLKIFALTDELHDKLAWGKQDKAGLRAAIALAPHRNEDPAHAKIIVANPKAAKLPAKPEPVPVQDPKLDQRPLSRADIEDKIVSLTFITGPHRTNTPALLDVLKEHKIKASFFVVGKNAESYPKIIARMVKEGHEVGNNTMNHPNFKNLTDEEILEEIRAAQKAIRKAAPVVPIYLRPPFGSITPEQQTLIQTKLGIIPVLWSIDSRDWLRHEPKVTAKRVIDAAHPGGIVLLHDIHKPTVEATRLIIEGLKNAEYRFTTVGTLDKLQEMKRK